MERGSSSALYMHACMRAHLTSCVRAPHVPQVTSWTWRASGWAGTSHGTCRSSELGRRRVLSALLRLTAYLLVLHVLHNDDNSSEPSPSPSPKVDGCIRRWPHPMHADGGPPKAKWRHHGAQRGVMRPPQSQWQSPGPMFDRLWRAVGRASRRYRMGGGGGAPCDGRGPRCTRRS